MASKCTITFDNNPFGVYYAGQVVSGQAELTTTRPKTIRSIYIYVNGFAEVRWTENVSKQNAEGKSEKAIETFSASELFYTEKFCPDNYSKTGGDQFELPAAKYVFPFRATISPNAPTSFNGAWGQIQHEVTLVIDRVMRYNNTFKKAYTVISPYDLNLNPNNSKPLQKIEEKTFCWSMCFGSNGPMVLTVKVPFSAYAPGQKVRFNAVLDNQSEAHCYDVKVRLMKKITYTSRSPSTKIQVTYIKVADNHCGEVVKHNKAEFNEYLQIPSTTPSSLESCSIIKVSYSLKFIAKLFRLHGDMVIEFPITIGTVPLHATTTDGPLSPPSFEEDVRSEQFENNTFKPRYPVFLSNASGVNTFGRNSNIVPPPQTNNSMYPSPHLNPSPAASPKQSTAVNPPYPIHTSAVATDQNKSKPPTQTSLDSNFEVLGFSVPPGYEPTPNPSAPILGDNIGWK